MHIRPLLIISLSLALLISGCGLYQPLAVRTSMSNYPQIGSPIIKEAPIVQDAEFNIYESSRERGKYYTAPTSLRPIEAERGTLLAVGLERSDGKHLIFVSSLGPKSDILSIARARLEKMALPIVSVEFYPITRLAIRPLTDPQVPQDISFTAISAPGFTISPFHILFVVQVRGGSHLVSMKQLLNGNPGILAEGTYTLRFLIGSAVIEKPRTIIATIGDVEITSLSM